jgi:hypothetical protein
MMMALIPFIAIGDGFTCFHHNWQCRRRLLLIVATTNSSDAQVAFAATLFTRLLN